MRYYPIFVDIRNRKVVVVGGGKVAERKVGMLLSCGAEIYLVSDEITDKLKWLVDSGKIHYLGKKFSEHLLDGAVLVIAATSDSNLNKTVSAKAKARNIFVNAVDQPQDCSFILPSVIERGDLIIAISTSGKSPALAKKIRQDLEHTFGSNYTLYVELMGRIREAVLSAGLPQPVNRRIFNSIVESDILQAISENDWQRVKAIIENNLPFELKDMIDIADMLPNG